MPVKLSTTVKNISIVPNSTNASLLLEFYEYMKEKGLSEKYQNGNLKVLILYARFLDANTEFYNINKKEQILAFFNTVKDSSRSRQNMD